jgi:hypothetical protein
MQHAILQDMCSSTCYVGLQADAEKALRQMEEESEVKRQKKLAEQAFMRMLRSKEPPMAVGPQHM